MYSVNIKFEGPCLDLLSTLWSTFRLFLVFVV